MSEYQYYEWQTVDRLLTEAEQESVSNLSSHIEVSSSRAVVTYSYGSFKHDPRQVLARFFDAHLYLANWGSRRLMFRFPSGLVSRDMIEPHCVQDRITFRTVKCHRLWTSSGPRATTRPFCCWPNWRSWPQSRGRTTTIGRE